LDFRGGKSTSGFQTQTPSTSSVTGESLRRGARVASRVPNGLLPVWESLLSPDLTEVSQPLIRTTYQCILLNA